MERTDGAGFLCCVPDVKRPAGSLRRASAVASWSLYTL
jgi:hypothetical protein